MSEPVFPAVPPASEPPRPRFTAREGLVPRTRLSVRDFERPGFVMREQMLHPASPSAPAARCYKCDQPFFANRYNAALIVYTRQSQFVHAAITCPYPECNVPNSQHNTLYWDADVLLYLLWVGCPITVSGPKAPKHIRRLFTPPGQATPDITDTGEGQAAVYDYAFLTQSQAFGLSS